MISLYKLFYEQNLSVECPNFEKCPFCECNNLTKEESSDLQSRYCLTGNYPECARYQFGISGEKVPINLHPDGHMIGD